MYVITFYSFKGGVGRSMALVNVGVQLAQAGKSVLLVDFDLEAPSLTTFNLEATASCRNGVIDFVTEYLETDRAPQVANYISAPQHFESGGRLWIMPSGATGGDYQSRLAKINWPDLYERRSGFLLMEEMKAQWENELKPDYVLIDSRTGHSDVSGICTRQLPDAVAFVFVPNRQNLDGLVNTVRQVRAEQSEDRTRPLETFFIESNVPYYDDERRTLEKNRRMFLERLNIRSFNATLHQHPHLSVLNQSVFVAEFPETSLAAEYRTLTDVVRSQNLGDRDIVLSQLKLMFSGLRISRNIELHEKKLEKISKLHGDDAEVCFWLGRVSRQLGEDDAALIQFNQSIERGYQRPEVLLERANLTLRKKAEPQVESASRDLRAALELLAEHPNFTDIQFALRKLMSITTNSEMEFSTLPAVRALPAEDQIRLAYDLNSSELTSEFAYAVLRRLHDENLITAKNQVSWSINFALICIRTKRFREAIESLSEPHKEALAEQARLFNRAIAIWGANGHPSVDDFKGMLPLDARLTEQLVANPNYLQCLAITSYVCDDAERAIALIERAKRLAQRTPTLHFSAWRYLKISPKEFTYDCDQLQEQISSGRTLSFPAIEPASESSQRTLQ